MTQQPQRTMNQPAPAPSKPLLKSKTFWLNLLALAAALYPPVQAFVAANPVTTVAALTAANTLVRFVTRDKVSLFPLADGTDAGTLPSWLLLAGLLGVMGFPLAACSPGQTTPPIPIHATYHKGGTTVTYDSKGGLGIEQDSGK